MKHFFLLFLLVPLMVNALTTPPAPHGPIPSARQLAWHERIMYAFIHFTTNTFNDKEWGYGDASPDIFNPQKFDPESWVKVLKQAGFTGIILTAKHHDGFCLWPTKYTDYSVKKSCWQGGKGDVVRAVSDAAKKYNLCFGIYLSPWDRHELTYGTPEYLKYYRNQLLELTQNYGPLFELWEDGANGGDGYYGGKREKRKIDSRTYYDWPTTNAIIHEMQPQACVFSDGGPDVRWCGNESGYVGETNWGKITKKNYSPGFAAKEGLECGEANGTEWVPAEVDVSIRPGWFFHEKENNKVKTGKELLDIYYNSVGRGSNLILNIPPNKDGLFNKEDIKSLQDFGNLLKNEFGNSLNSLIKNVEASNVRGNHPAYNATNTLDENHKSYWTTDDEICKASITFTFQKPTLVNRSEIREYLPLGQRISSFNLEIQTESNEWKEVAKATTIGNRRLLRFANVKAKAIRLNILESQACPVISDIRFFLSSNK